MNRAMILASLVALLGCSVPVEQKAAGTFRNKKMIVAVHEEAGTTLSTRAFINGEVVLDYKYPAFIQNDPNCGKLSIASWKCQHITSYQGLPVKIERHSQATLSSLKEFYDFYIDGEYVQTVVTKSR